MRKRLALYAAALLVACVPTAAQATAHADPAKDFSACVRSNGVPDFPDVRIVNGAIQLGKGVDPFAEKLRAAVESCDHLLPEGTTLPARRSLRWSSASRPRSPAPERDGVRRSERAPDPVSGRCYFFGLSVLDSVDSAATKASCGTSTRPTIFIRFLPSFCFSSSFRLREMSPP
ncbi:hypothetical protein H4W81_005160 [Nonomuraea africana]|uniref:DUF732 domain-containing protein n=1 Tax=Nonomuraea africana TaxID=46171 RepID=A0ABR9KK46_9ACTN|nr:hypothetical protein [Nonomuraea africana]